MTAVPARITLASASPRRKDLLAQIGIDAIVAPSHADESVITLESLRAAGTPASEAPGRLALDRARLKAESAQHRPGTAGLLAADTIVAIDDASLEKPRDREDARRMLAALSGRTHTVSTGVVFAPADGDPIEELVVTEVTFLSLQPAEIERYLDTGEWQGVAGGYRIQGRAGAFVTHLAGSYSAVVGLPIGTVYSMIRRFSVDRES